MPAHTPGLPAVPDDLSTLGTLHRFQVVIVSYGEGHQDPPDDIHALTVNLVHALRNPPADPAVRDRLARLTGLDKTVREYVMNTPGARTLVDAAAERVRVLLLGWAQPRGKNVVVHVKCWGGRHRSVAVASELAALLAADGIGVEVEHRHIDRPLLPCRAGRAA